VNEDVCFDASVAVKWVLREEGTDAARRILADVLRGGQRIVAPPHLIAEVTSAIYRRLRIGEILLPEAIERMSTFVSIPIELVAPPALAPRALQLASEFRWGYPYGAMYLAVGELLDCEVWTADRDFSDDAHEKYPRLRLLSELA
jgi:predicted nucleic acid-binding protein